MDGNSGAFDVDVTETDGMLSIEAHCFTNSTFTAAEARQIASALAAGADVVEAAALPGAGSPSSTVSVEQIARLAGCDPYTVRQAIIAQELTAHAAVDGSGDLLLCYDEAVAWVNAWA